MLLYISTLSKYGVKHAMMQEVAHLEWGNFCGVCPILNRAKNTKEYIKDLAAFMCNGQAIGCPELSVNPSNCRFYNVP